MYRFECVLHCKLPRCTPLFEWECVVLRLPLCRARAAPGPLGSPSVWHVIVLLEITIRAVILMQMMSSHSRPALNKAACLCVPPLPVKIRLPPARPLAFPFDSSFYSCLSSFMFLSVLCTCQVEYPCIINDSAVLSLLLHPSVPRSQAAVRSTGLASRLVSSQQRGRGSGAQPERLPC